VTIIAIMAVDASGAIGLNNRLPWKHNAEDMSWFYKNTKNQIVCMGRRTWESPDMQQPLAKRKNVVFTHDMNFKSENESVLEFVSTDNIPEKLREIQKKFPDQDVFVIGGKDIYWKALPAIEEIYVTLIRKKHEADTYMDLKEYTKDFSCEVWIEKETIDIEIWKREENCDYVTV
jgi:dihydrofolate reductase